MGDLHAYGFPSARGGGDRKVALVDLPIGPNTWYCGGLIGDGSKMCICPRDACTVGLHSHKAQLDPIRHKGQDEAHDDLGKEICFLIPAEPQKIVYCGVVLSI